LGKRSATVESTSKAKPTSVDEEEDFKKMFKDLDYSKLSDMDQAYIRNFYVNEMQKIEDKKKGIYKPKKISPGLLKKKKPEPKTKIISITVPKKPKAPVVKQEPKEEAKKTKVDDKAVSKSDDIPLLNSKDKKVETKKKGIYIRLWTFILNFKYLILGVIILSIMGKYGFTMRKLKAEKEKDIQFNNVGYEYEYFNANQNQRSNSRKVLQI